jgi:hypothetical protein
MSRRLPLALAIALPLVLSGCSKEEPCLAVQQLDASVYKVLPSGLVLHSTDAGTSASLLGEDGTLELVAALPTGLGAEAVAHDPARGKLWWIPVTFDESTPVLHQLDLETGTEDWQRELVFDGYLLDSWSASLLAHEGALYLGGRLDAELPEGGWENRSLLERVDEAGEVVWTQIGYPSPQSADMPLEGLHTLVGTSTGVSFLGYITGIDSSIVTAVTVDAPTGELLGSTLVDTDDYSSVNRMSGDGESLYVMTGERGGEMNHARSDIRAITPLGEEHWRIGEFVWSKFVDPVFAQAVVGDELVHLVAGSLDYQDPQRAHVTRRRTADGSLLCASDLPDIPALGSVIRVDAHAVQDLLVLEVSLEEPEHEPVFLLLTRND